MKSEDLPFMPSLEDVEAASVLGRHGITINHEMAAQAGLGKMELTVLAQVALGLAAAAAKNGRGAPAAAYAYAEKLVRGYRQQGLSTAQAGEALVRRGRMLSASAEGRAILAAERGGRR